MLRSMKLRKALKQRRHSESKMPLGRYIKEHVNLTSDETTQFEQRKKQILPLINTPNFIIVDEWHTGAIVDIFASELIYDMQNNIADYVFDELLPEQYLLQSLPPLKARTFTEIKELIGKFPNSSQLLKHLFAVELKAQKFDPHHNTIILHEGPIATPLTAERILECMLNRGTKPMTQDPLETIVDLAFPELLFCLRQLGKSRFSVSASSNHETALATPVKPDEETLEKIMKSERRFTVNGEVVPSWREYTALFVTFFCSLLMFGLGVWRNWAGRDNILERVFDGVGLFGLVAGVLLAIFSRRLDFYDLAGIIQRRKRFLESYAELLSVLNLSDNDVKSALTFEGVRVPPLARDCTSFAFHRHDGVFNPFSGLDTTVTNSNIIVGNKAAISRGFNEVKYYKLRAGGRGFEVVPADDAIFRIITDGDVKRILIGLLYLNLK